jgi:DNA-directed RNA polymerase subunit RPC12/RpoP
MPDEPPPLTPEELPKDQRVHHDPVVTKAAPAGRKFPCPACGARLDFAPSQQGLKCPYCGYEEVILADDSIELAERNYREYLEREESNGSIIQGRSTETKCPGCGAVVLLEDKMATEQCPFCGTHLESKPEAAHAMIQPEGVLPFAIDLRGARAAFEKWIHSLWFAPYALKKAAALGQLTGVYVPFWTYDSMTYTQYEGQRGENYTTTEWYTTTGADGKTERRSRTVTKTRWYWVSGQVNHFFDDVLVCASTSMRRDLVSDLGRWKLGELEPFSPGYLSGFKTERYAVGLTDGLVIAKELMQPTIDSNIRRDIGGDHQRISSKRTQYTAITFKHILLPVWVAVYRFQEKRYQILVNGRTGKVTGDRPWSFWKITGLVLLILLIVALVGLLVMWLR